MDGIPHDWIVDELREAEMVSMWQDLRGYLDTVKRSYRRDNWQDQPHYTELWSEKATVLGSMRPITQELGVMLRACRGFGSTGMEGQVGNLFESIHKPITVFYIGSTVPARRPASAPFCSRSTMTSPPATSPALRGVNG